MIRHVVLIKPQPNLDPDLIEQARSGLEALPGQIPGIAAFAFGLNNSPEGMTKGFEIGFTIDFVDAAARDAYLPHPAHQAYIPSVGAIAADVLVFDFEI